MKTKFYLSALLLFFSSQLFAQDERWENFTPPCPSNCDKENWVSVLDMGDVYIKNHHITDTNDIILQSTGSNALPEGAIDGKHRINICHPEIIPDKIYDLSIISISEAYFLIFPAFIIASVYNDTILKNLTGKIINDDYSEYNLIQFRTDFLNDNPNYDELEFEIDNWNINDTSFYSYSFQHNTILTAKASNQLCGYTEVLIELKTDFPTSTIPNWNQTTQPNIYPNPSNGIFQIELNSDQGSIQIYNIMGILVHEQIPQGKINQIDLKDLSPGAYFIHYGDKDQRQESKIIIQ